MFLNLVRRIIPTIKFLTPNGGGGGARGPDPTDGGGGGAGAEFDVCLRPDDLFCGGGCTFEAIGDGGEIGADVFGGGGGSGIFPIA
jgi:hypothetical protein